MTTYTVTTKQGTFTVSVSELKQGVDLQTVVSELEKELSTKLAGSKLISNQAVSQNGLSGRDLVVDLAGLGKARARVFISGNRMFSAAVMGSFGGDANFYQSQDADRFLGSLAVTGN